MVLKVLLDRNMLRVLFGLSLSSGWFLLLELNPLAARTDCLLQTLAVFTWIRGLVLILRLVRRWFDP